MTSPVAIDADQFLDASDLALIAFALPYAAEALALTETEHGHGMDDEARNRMKELADLVHHNEVALIPRNLDWGRRPVGYAPRIRGERRVDLDGAQA